MADSNEIDDIINEIRIKKERIDNGENPFEEIGKPVDDEEVVINLGEIDNDTSAQDSQQENEILIEDEAPAEKEEDSSKEENDEDSFEFVDDSNQEDYSAYYEELVDEHTGKKKKKNLPVIIALVVVAAIVIGGIVFAVAKHNQKPEPTTAAPTTTTTTTLAPKPVLNPLTGAKGFNKSAVGVRPVGLVVENSQPARPQWGIDDEKYSPDIIVEGEVEGGETRMLWLYADYTALPEQVGPMRSARPPFIKFSQLFDAIFIHWGQSSSKGNYVGADSVFREYNVDHINQMTFSDRVGLYDRDHSRNVSTEHTGILYGAKLKDAIKQEGFRTKADESKYTCFSFNEAVKQVSQTPCNTLALKFSNRTNVRDWTYSTEDKLYHSSDYKTDVKRENLLVLFDNTTYVDKANYKGSGRSETYCNYGLDGGKGKLASMGTVVDITWSADNGVIEIKDLNGKTVNLNPGKTWIGWASANNSGSVTIG